MSLGFIEVGKSRRYYVRCPERAKILMLEERYLKYRCEKRFDGIEEAMQYASELQRLLLREINIRTCIRQNGTDLFSKRKKR